MKFTSLLRQLTYLKTTVRSSYGNGAIAWIRLIYYSLFRINKFVIMRFDLEEQNVAALTVPDVAFSHHRRHESDTCRNGDNMPREFFCDQFHKVSNYCLGTYNGNTAYIHWICYQKDFSRFLKIGSDSVEINYVITLPEYRGHGISTAAVCYSLLRLREEGIRQVFAVIHEDNIASVKAFVKAGFIDFGTTFSFGLFNRKVAV